MTTTHQSDISAGSLQRLGPVTRSLRIDGAWRFEAGRAGWLAVTEGRVWLTRDGGGDDHVLAAGEQLWLGRGTRVVVENWQPAVAARLGWRADVAAAAQPRRGEALPALGDGTALRAAPAALATGAADAAWAGVARALRGLAAGLLAAARSAEARASRAQGSIPAGESMASSGALQ